MFGAFGAGALMESVLTLDKTALVLAVVFLVFAAGISPKAEK